MPRHPPNVRRSLAMRDRVERWEATSPRWSPWFGAALAILCTALVTALMLSLRSHLGVLNPALIYLLVVVAVTLVWGGRAAVIAAVASFLAFDYVFIPPYRTLSVSQPDHLLALFVYLAVAILIARLVAQARQRADVAERETRRTALLYELNAALVSDVTLDAILATIVERVVQVYGARRGRILLPGPDGVLAVQATFPPETDAPDRQALAMAELALHDNRPTGLSTHDRRVRAPHPVGARPSPPLRRGTSVLSLPIAAGQQPIGVLEVTGRRAGGRFDAEDERILVNFADQAALALQRARLAEDASRAAVLARSDELKSALLAAVSHDLRTPLAVIKASVTSMLDRSVPWSDDERREFLLEVDAETDRLAHMVGNLLDLTRIEAGVLRPDLDWYDAAEVVDDVVRRMTPHAERTGHRLVADVAPEVPMARFDSSQIAQVLANLVENAIAYSGTGGEIVVGARSAPCSIEMFCRDEGPGIPIGERTRVFEKFQRLHTGSVVSGTGIGLSICKGIVEAHDGQIWVEDAPGGGAMFRFRLSLPVQAEQTR